MTDFPAGCRAVKGAEEDEELIAAEGASRNCFRPKLANNETTSPYAQPSPI